MPNWAACRWGCPSNRVWHRPPRRSRCQTRRTEGHVEKRISVLAPALALAVAAGRPLLARQPFAAGELDEVILGCMMPSPDEANIGRVAALRLGCGDRVTAWTVQRNCASGMQALASAARDIAADRADLVLAGGSEAMSHAPVMLGERMVVWLAGWNQARGLGRMRQLAALRPAHLRPGPARGGRLYHFGLQRGRRRTHGC